MNLKLKNLPDVSNEAFYPLHWDRHRVQVLYGGAGSGKSESAASNTVFRMVREPGVRALLIRKTKASIRRSSYQLVKDVIYRRGWEPAFRFRDPACEIECVNGSTLISAGLDDPEKLKSITAIDFVWVEEATEIDQDAFDQIDLRLRSRKRFNQITMTFNPVSAMHWIKGRWIPDEGVPAGEIVISPKDDDVAILKTTYKHNRFCAPGYGERIERLAKANPSFYKIYVLAEWGDLRGMVYPEPAAIKEADWPKHFDERFFGCDFGFANPTAIVQCGLSDGTLYFRQLCYQSGMLTSDIIALLRGHGIENHEPIYCDTAEPARIQEICNAGFNGYPSDKGVSGGIALMQNIAPWNVHEDSTDIFKERASYCWAETRNGIALDVPVKLNDHLLDAMRYAAFTHLGAREEFRIDMF